MLIIVSDHAGFELKQMLMESGFLEQFDTDIVDTNRHYDGLDDYPDKVHLVPPILRRSPDARIIGLCGSGQGMCMALNKLQSVRAGLGYDASAAKMMRVDNNANAICFSTRNQSPDHIKELIAIFMTTDFSDQSRHIRRVQKLDKLAEISNT